MAGSWHDRVLYKARLAEIEQDQEMGRLDAASVTAVKNEEARKLIRLERDAAQLTTSLSPRTRSAILTSALFFVPVFTIGFYVLVSGNSPNTSIVAQEASPSSPELSISEIIKDAEKRLAENPSDAKGWILIAPIYLRIGRITDAVSAYRKALLYSAREPKLLSALGEALVIQSDGSVSDEAQALFGEVLEFEPQNVQAGYYIGLASAQNGQTEEARSTWQAIVDRATGDEPWLPRLKNNIAMLTGADSLSRTPELDERAVEDASELSASERSEMISQMVASLANRLEDNPDDIVGWERLVRSYMVLGRKEDALSSIAKARSNFPNNLEFIQKLEKIEASLK